MLSRIREIFKKNPYPTGSPPIAALNDSFIVRVREFYDTGFSHHPDFTGSFEADKIKDSFGRALKAHIEDETAISNPFNHRTLINMVKSGIAPNAKNHTLNTLSRFCGYSDFDTFCNAGVVPKKTWKNKGWALGATILALALIYWGVTRTDPQQDAIFSVIEKANRAQFEAYRKLPDVFTDDLKKYYSAEGSACRVIEDILKRSSARNRTIHLPAGNPSYYTLHDMKLINRDSDRATVETREHWYLRWYNTGTGAYELKYDVSNTQIYILRREAGGWKVHANDYMGTAEVVK